MSVPPGRNRVLERASAIAAMATVAIACIVLTGWFLDVELLRAAIPLPSFGPMAPDAAMGFLLAGIALLLLKPVDAAPLRRLAGRLLAAGMALQGVLALVQYVFHPQPGVDLLLLRETVRTLAGDVPGRPTPNTALAFLLLGLALAFLDTERPRKFWPAQLLALLVALLAFQTLLGHAYGEQELWANGRWASAAGRTPMAVDTAFTLLLASLATFLARPDRGYAAACARPDMSGIVLRRMMAGAFLVPATVGWLRQLGQLVGLYTTAVGISLFVVATTTGLIVLTGLTVAFLRRLDLQRSAAEDALRLSEARLSGIISITADAIILLNEDLNVTLFNSGAERMFGYSAAEVLGKSHDRFIPERFRGSHPQHIRDFAAGKATTRLIADRSDVFGLRKNGEEFPIEFSICRLEVGDERLFAIVLRDITVRRQTAEALERSEEGLRLAQRIAQVGNIDWDLTTDVRRWSDQIYTLLGLAPQSQPASRAVFLSMLHPDERLREEQRHQRMLETGQGESAEYRLLLPDGTRRYVHADATIIFDQSNRPVRFVGTLQDITERKRAELAEHLLADTGTLFAGALDPAATLSNVARLTVPTLADWCEIDVIEPGGRIKIVEVAAADSSQDGLLRSLQTAYPLDRRYGDSVLRVLETGEPWMIQTLTDAQLEEWAGEPDHLELLRGLAPRSIMVVPMVARGRTLGAMLLAGSTSGRHYDGRDLTLALELAHRAALAVDNGQLYQEAERAIRVRDEVLRIVAHDLRSPLSAITLTTGLLGRHASPEDQRKLETILSSARRANRLIQDLLDAARIASGQLALEVSPQAVASVVRDCLEEQKTVAEVRSLRLEVQLPERLPAIRVDRGRALQILNNLLGNAIKFTPPGGRITVRAEDADEMVRFSVSDTGPGIADEHQPHLFEPFWQARQGHSREGAGLGLVIVRGFVEAHGGRIWVDSKLGAGSTFTFTLPAVRARGGDIA